MFFGVGGRFLCCGVGGCGLRIRGNGMRVIICCTIAYHTGLGSNLRGKDMEICVELKSMPAAADVLVQLEAADRLEAAGRHGDAVVYAANAVEEWPGHEDVLDWEQRLLAGEHDPSFDVHKFLFGTSARAATGEGAGGPYKREVKPEQGV